MNKPTLPTWAKKIEYNNKNCEYKNAVLHLEPEQKDGYIEGNILAERMKEKGLSASVLDYLIDNPAEIPEEWKGKWIYFWGTIYRSSGGSLYVRYLCFDGGHWRQDYDWLVNSWGSSRPSAVSASPQNSNTKNSSDFESFDLRLQKIESLVENMKEVFNNYSSNNK